MIKHFVLRIAILFICSAFSQSIAAKVWINEVMQSNIDGIVDDRRDFPDSWIELYNDGEEDIDVRNWYVSETQDYNQGWKIPQSVIVPAKGFVILYFDKEGYGLHANFRIDSGKTKLYLFNTSLTEVDATGDIPKQPAPGIARGRIQDGGAAWGYFIKATPASTNGIENNVATILAPDPIFSKKGRVSKTAITVTLSLPDNAPEGILAEHIHYTTDGSEPTEDSPVYQKTLIFNRPSNLSYGIEANVLKAKIIAPGFLTNRSVAQTYIITNRSLTLPIISLSLDNKYMYDDEFGIYVNGNGKYGKPGNCIDWNANWNNDWRRPAHIEYFPSQDQESTINQLGEIRIAGGCSRGNPQRSLIVYANKRFGEKRFNYQLFNEKPRQEIKSFMIRNSGNDFWQAHFRDAAIQLFMGGKVDVDYQAYQPAILLVNGEYMGIENLRERSNEDFVVANYNGLEDIDMLERPVPGWELKMGTRTAFDIMFERIKAPTDQLSYEELAQFVDVENFINYNILQMYIANTDYPHNNVVIWRPNKDATGKWRYILKDTDFGLGLYGTAYNFNSFTDHFLYANDDTRLLRRLLDKKPFRDAFIEHFAIYMGDILSKESTAAIIDSLKQHIQTEVPYHRRRYGMGGTTEWDIEVNKMKNWAAYRNGYVYTHMNAYFSLRGNIPMKLDISPEVTGTDSIVINGIRLQKPAFNGQYFKGRTLRIRWAGSEDSNFLGWKITTTNKQEVSSKEIHDNEITYLIPTNCTNVQFTAISRETSNTQHVTDGNRIQVDASDDGITISNLTELSTITIIDTSGRVVSTMQTRNTSAHFPILGTSVYLVKITNRNETICRKVVKQK